MVLFLPLSFSRSIPPLDGPQVSMAEGSTPPGPADLALTNGRIYTVDRSHPWAGAVAIRGEWIVAVADSESTLSGWMGPKTRVIDLRGQFAMPGFNDAHVHLAGAGQAKLQVRFDGARSLAEFQQRIRERLSDFKPGEWMTGRGWDHTLWPVQEFPTRQDLDAVAGDRPMIFGRVDGHVAVANTRALEIAGITRATPDPAGGHIARSATGDPTGMLEEDAAMNLVYGRIPPLSAEQRRRALELALAEASRFGVTSVQDNSVNESAEGNFSWQNFLVYQAMQKEGKLTARITEWLPFTATLARLEEMRRAGGTTDPWVKTGTLKAFLDGSLGARTAALLAPYSDDPSTSGILRMDADEVTRMSIERDRAGFQLAFHAIGDRANRVALDTFAAVAKADGPRGRRDRIEHAQIMARQDLPRLAALGVIASMQPSHWLDDARWAVARLGPERLASGYDWAWRSVEESGARLAFGTDYPVESIDPLRGLYACVTREPAAGAAPAKSQREESLSMEDCLRAYTAGSAYAEFEENRKGAIAEGMLADIVVLDNDITRIPPRGLLESRVAMTIAGGRVVYEAAKQ